MRGQLGRCRGPEGRVLEGDSGVRSVGGASVFLSRTHYVSFFFFKSSVSPAWGSDSRP